MVRPAWCHHWADPDHYSYSAAALLPLRKPQMKGGGVTWAMCYQRQIQHHSGRPHTHTAQQRFFSAWLYEVSLRFGGMNGSQLATLLHIDRKWRIWVSDLALDGANTGCWRCLWTTFICDQCNNCASSLRAEVQTTWTWARQVVESQRRNSS